jgi:hypothetical protein
MKVCILTAAEIKYGEYNSKACDKWRSIKSY